jgi:hypothetical protein
LNLKPSVLSTPQSLALLPGAAAEFHVSASPDTTSIQWLFNGAIMPSQTSATLSIPSVSAANAGLYQAVLTNPNGTTTTQPASLSFLAFSQGWIVDTDFSSVDTDFSSALPTFTATSIGTDFLIRKLDSAGNLAAGFTSPLFTAPITTNSFPRYILPYADGSFTVTGSFTTAGGSPAPAGVARFNSQGARLPTHASTGLFSSIVPETTLPLPNGSLLVGGDLAVQGASPAVRNLVEITSEGTLASHPGLERLTRESAMPVFHLAAAPNSSAVLVAHQFSHSAAPEHALVSRILSSSGPLPGAPTLAILGTTQDRYAEPGEAITLTVAAVGADLAFQWLKNGVEIPDATSSSLIFATVTPADAAQYRVRVSDFSGTLTSAPITLTIPGASPPPGGFTGWPALADLPPDQRDPLASPAGDAVPNLIKYAIGIGPLDSAAGRIPQSVVEGSATEEGYPLVSFIRATTAPGVALKIQSSTTLDFADDLGVTVVSTEPLGDGTERVTVRSNARFRDHSRQFFRLEAREEP